jgi:hypothetical protein
MHSHFPAWRKEMIRYPSTKKWTALLMVGWVLGCETGPRVTESSHYEAVAEDARTFDRLVKEMRTTLKGARADLQGNRVEEATKKVEEVQKVLDEALAHLDNMEKGLKPPGGKVAKGRRRPSTFSCRGICWYP